MRLLEVKQQKCLVLHIGNKYFWNKNLILTFFFWTAKFLTIKSIFIQAFFLVTYHLSLLFPWPAVCQWFKIRSLCVKKKPKSFYTGIQREKHLFWSHIIYHCFSLGQLHVNGSKSGGLTISFSSFFVLWEIYLGTYLNQLSHLKLFLLWKIPGILASESVFECIYIYMLCI